MYRTSNTTYHAVHKHGQTRKLWVC